MAIRYTHARGNMVVPSDCNDLPAVDHFQLEKYIEDDEKKSESNLAIHYSDSNGKWHRLRMSLEQGMYLLCLLRELQQNIGFPLPDDSNGKKPHDVRHYKSDPWIQSNAPIEPEKLHALGLVTLRWNSCDLGLKLLFAGVVQLTFRAAWAITHDMSDVSACSIMREIVNSSDHPIHEMTRDAVLHALQIYDINRINRNQLTHFLPSGDALGGRQFLRAKGPAYDPQPFPSSLGDVRRVAEDLNALSAYLAALANWFGSRKYAKFPDEFGPLPEKPPVPEKLWRSPPPNRSKLRKSPAK